MKTFLILLLAITPGADVKMSMASCLLQASPEVTIEIRQNLGLTVDAFLSHCAPEINTSIQQRLRFTKGSESKTLPAFTQLKFSKENTIAVSLGHLFELFSIHFRIDGEWLNVGDLDDVNPRQIQRISVNERLLRLMLPEEVGEASIELFKNGRYDVDLMDSLYSRKIQLLSVNHDSQTLTISGRLDAIQLINRELEQEVNGCLLIDQQQRTKRVDHEKKTTPKSSGARGQATSH